MNKKIVIITLLVVVVLLLPVAVIIIGSVSGNDSPGWHTRDDSKIYYINEDGSKAVGYQLIDGIPYYFDWNGKPAKQGWIEDSPEDTYYSEGEGRLATGWKYLEGKVWYFYKSNDRIGVKAGQLARDWTTQGGIPIPADGGIDGDRGLALAYGIDVLNRYGWSLKSAYRYSASLRFERGSDEHYGFTIPTTAIYGFKNGGGNCLAWSGTFCVMAKLLGYDCRQVWGKLEWKEIVPHAWTEIWESDGPHVYDPRKHDGEDMAGFDVHYGDPGSYKYDINSKEYLKW